jgi:TatD DNase family protein
MPYRGKRNEPAYVKQVAERVAVVREATFEQIAAETTAACEEFFRIKD